MQTLYLCCLGLVFFWVDVMRQQKHYFKEFLWFVAIMWFPYLPYFLYIPLDIKYLFWMVFKIDEFMIIQYARPKFITCYDFCMRNLTYKANHSLAKLFFNFLYINIFYHLLIPNLLLTLIVHCIRLCLFFIHGRYFRSASEVALVVLNLTFSF